MLHRARSPLDADFIYRRSFHFVCVLVMRREHLSPAMIIPRKVSQIISWIWKQIDLKAFSGPIKGLFRPYPLFWLPRMTLRRRLRGCIFRGTNLLVLIAGYLHSLARAQCRILQRSLLARCLSLSLMGPSIIGLGLAVGIRISA